MKKKKGVKKSSFLKRKTSEKEKKKPLKKVKTAKKEKAAKPVKTPKTEISLKDIKEFKWTPEMSVHENTIDSQHQKLIGKLNELSKNLDSNDLGFIRGILDFVGKYAKEHFSYEEGYMKKISYPNTKFSHHLKEHKDFVKFFENYSSDFKKAYNSKKVSHEELVKMIEKAREYLGKWLIHHIMREDHDYMLFAQGKGNKKEGKGKIDISSITKEIQEQLKEQREPVEEISKLDLKEKSKNGKAGKGNKISDYVRTGVPGFDELFDHGIPRTNSVIVAGGAGSGKTIFCLQTLINKAKEGKKCMYLTLEESEERLLEHMEGFGWNPRDFVKKGHLKIVRMNPFDITRNVDAMLAKQKGELLIDIDPVIIPKNFKPDFIVIDSLTAIASAFTNKDESYRIYIEQLFRFLENLGCTSLLITETEQVPKIYSTTGVEEFLADGVIVLYNIKRGDVRENALEVLKMRGEKHQKKIVAMQITGNGIVVYPEQEVFGEI